MRTDQSRLNSVKVTAVATASILSLILFSSWNRPLLYDEFVYFVAGSLSLSEVMMVIHETTNNVNQGVTGAYLFSDWVLMQIVGAADWALRLPSLLFGVFFFVYALTFLRHRGVGAIGLAIFPVFMITQELVMHYVGEARTYLPLAAAAVGLLTYYSASESWRQSGWGRATGWSAAIIGVLFHPYVALYWPAMVLFGYWVAHRGAAKGRFSIRSLALWANPVMVIVGIALFTAIALTTWARGRATAFVDPFNFLPGPLPVEILAQNLYAYTPLIVAGMTIAALIITAGTLTVRVTANQISAGLRSLSEPAVLFVLAFALALVVSLTTIAAGFWIFPRQWIASTALAALAIFWGGYLLWQQADHLSGTRGVIAGVALTGGVVVAAIPVAMQQVSDLGTWSARPAVTQPDQSRLANQLARGETLTDSDWMQYSQVNLDTNGPVWPEFRSYYLETDWSQFVLRD